MSKLAKEQRPITFKAPTMTEVLQKVQAEVGSEALVLSARSLKTSSWQVWRKPQVEVVVLPQETPQLEPPKAAPQLEPAKPAGARTPAEDILVEFAKYSSRQAETAVEPLVDVQPEVRRAVEPPAPAKKKTTGNERATFRSPILQKIEKHLLSQGVNDVVVEQVIHSCGSTLSPYAIVDESRVKNYVKQQMGAMLRSKDKYDTAEPKLLCLIGSSGVGKTETCAKLLAHYRGFKGMKVAWINADTIRIGAIAQAQVYADSLDVEVVSVYSAEELTETIEKIANRVDLIIVDTPGVNPMVEESLVALGEILTAMPERKTYLVASSTANEANLQRTFSALAPFALDGLIVTKLDESESLGGLFNAVNAAKVPLIYYTNGIQLFENLHEATPISFIGMLLGEGIPA